MKGLLSFGLPFLFKVIIPGIVGAIAVSPLIVSIGIRCGVDAELSKTMQLIIGLLFTGLTLSIGFAVYFLDDYIYRIFEGYLWWPKRLRLNLTKRLNEEIVKLREKIDKTEDKFEKQLLWERLMRFPLKMKEGGTEPETEAVLPTRLGNILCSYESYPRSRYGINAIFFWPRLWLSIDDETRKEMNAIWAEADCLTYISFILLCTSILYLLAAFIFNLLDIQVCVFASIGKLFGWSSIIGDIILLVVVGITSLISSHLFYRLSLKFHERNGAFFQSLFDLYRDKLKEMTQLYKIEAELKNNMWEKTWAYLKYGQKKEDS